MNTTRLLRIPLAISACATLIVAVAGSAGAQALRCRLACNLETRACLRADELMRTACADACANEPSTRRASCVDRCATPRGEAPSCHEENTQCRNSCGELVAPAERAPALACERVCTHELAGCAKSLVRDVEHCVEACDQRSDPLDCLDACGQSASDEQVSCVTDFTSCTHTCAAVGGEKAGGKKPGGTPKPPPTSGTPKPRPTTTTTLPSRPAKPQKPAPPPTTTTTLPSRPAKPQKPAPPPTTTTTTTTLPKGTQTTFPERPPSSETAKGTGKAVVEAPKDTSLPADQVWNSTPSIIATNDLKPDFTPNENGKTTIKMEMILETPVETTTFPEEALKMWMTAHLRLVETKVPGVSVNPVDVNNQRDDITPKPPTRVRAQLQNNKQVLTAEWDYTVNVGIPAGTPITFRLTVVDAPENIIAIVPTKATVTEGIRTQNYVRLKVPEDVTKDTETPP